MAKAMSPIERAQAKIDAFEKPEGEEKPEESGQQVEEGGEVEVAPETPKEEPKEQPKEEPKKDDGLQAKFEALQKDHKELEQKWKSFHGTFGPMKARLEELEKQNRLMAQQLEDSESSNVLSGDASKGELATHLNQLREDYGTEFVEIMQGLMRGMIDERVRPVEESVKKNQVNTEQSQRDAFKANLTMSVPDWEDHWNSEEFGLWLAQNSEPLTGKSYEQLFMEANNNWDLARVARFFTTYKTATGKQPAPKTEAVQEKKADPREQLVAPGRSNASANVTPPGNKKIWTLAEVNTFYKDVQTGRFQGREKEAEAIDQEIFLANIEDRIRK